MDNESIPYRSGVPTQILVTSNSADTLRDEANYDTLRAVHKALKSAVDDLDRWHAFDLEEKELELKQQVKAHQLTFEILAPLLDVIATAVQKVDNKYRER